MILLKTTQTLALLLLALTLVTGFPSPASARLVGDFTGLFQTTFGPLVLQQTDDRVTGAWFWNGSPGTLTGTVADGKLTFTYSEAVGPGTGSFEFLDGGSVLKGTWAQKDGPSGTWEGSRDPGFATLGGRDLEAPMPFDGIFQSTFGPMRLARDANHVVGSYTEGGGRLEGSVSGEELHFTWKDSSGEGTGIFTPLAGGRALAGRWRPAAAGPEAPWQPWHAVAVGPERGVSWLVILEARWETSLAQPEYSFGEMVRAFMARTPAVRVRHRFFANAQALERWCREVAMLPGPVVLVLAAHGTAGGLSCGDVTVPVERLAGALSTASNLKLVHFSSCLMMTANQPERLQAALAPSVRVPVSGYTTAVDWAGSAVVEFLLYDLVLTRGLPPAEAVAQVRRLMPFAGDAVPADSAVPALGLTIRPAPGTR